MPQTCRAGRVSAWFVSRPLFFARHDRVNSPQFSLFCVESIVHTRLLCSKMREATRRRQRPRGMSNLAVKLASDKGRGDAHSVAETASTGSISLDEALDTVDAMPSCDACHFCNDHCENNDCVLCGGSVLSEDMNELMSCPPCGQGTSRTYTMCQVRRHNNASSAWLVVGDRIYDATSYIDIHPGGAESILRKAGGSEDCTVDLHFHSKSGKRMWEKCFVGKLRPCDCEPDQVDGRQWWMFWAR